MRLMLLYRAGDEGAHAVEQYVRDFLRQQPNNQLELIDADGQEGSRVSELYGIVAYPVILATADDGSLIRLWQGAQLPLFSELTALPG